MTRKILFSRVRSFLLLFSFFLLLLSSSSVDSLPRIDSYARVTINRAKPIVIVEKNLTDRDSDSHQARSFRDMTISRSPVYVSPGTDNLRNGEAVDHASSTRKYTTLDPEAIAQFDNSRIHAQKRFHPPASFEHIIAHSNAVTRQKPETQGGVKQEQQQTPDKPAFPVPAYATLPKDLYSPSYDYQRETKPTSDVPPAGTLDDYSGDSFSKIPDSYAQPEIYETDNSEDSSKLYTGFQSSSSYKDNYPPKPAHFSNHYEGPSYVDAPYVSHSNFDHDLIYDHPPEHHYHDHPTMTTTTTTTTEEPEMNDQRLSKRPYSYYYIGKKLWYLPLYFSIYFIIYIAALVLKSIARHKINFPASLASVAADARTSNDGPSWYDLTKRVLDGIDLYNSIEKSKDYREANRPSHNISP